MRLSGRSATSSAQKEDLLSFCYATLGSRPWIRYSYLRVMNCLCCTSQQRNLCRFDSWTISQCFFYGRRTCTAGHSLHFNGRTHCWLQNNLVGHFPNKGMSKLQTAGDLPGWCSGCDDRMWGSNPESSIAWVMPVNEIMFSSNWTWRLLMTFQRKERKKAIASFF